MTKILSSILSLPWVGTIAGIVGVALAVIFYLKGKRRPRLCSKKEEFSVIGNPGARFPGGLQILFRGVEVNRVTSTRVYLWNAGNTTIDSSHLLKSDPLRLQIEEGELLEFDIDRRTRAVNDFKAEKSEDGSALLLSFEYLDPGDGASIIVIHSGGKRKAQILGSVKEIRRGISEIVLPDSRYQNLIIQKMISANIVSYFALLVGLIGMLSGFFAWYITPLIHKVDPTMQIETGVSWPFVVGGGIYFLLGFQVLWASRRRYPKALQDPDTRPLRRSRGKP